MGLFNWLARKSSEDRTSINSIDRARIKEMLDDGMEISEIGTEMGVNPKRISNYLYREEQKKISNSPIGELLKQMRELKRYEQDIKDEVRKELEQEYEEKEPDTGMEIIKALLGGVKSVEQPNTGTQGHPEGSIVESVEDTQGPKGDKKITGRARGGR